MADWIKISYTDMIELIVKGEEIVLRSKGNDLYYKPEPDNRWIENQYKDMREENDQSI